MKYIFGNIINLILLITALGLTSCFKEDERLFPPAPGEAEVYRFNQSIYTHQSYFDFSADTVTSSSPIESWHIEFAASEDAWEIRVNSGSYYQVYPTGDTLFNGIVSVTDPLKYITDNANGDPDSSAFASWIDRSSEPFLPTNEVFLIGLYDGIKTRPKWKIRIESVSDTAYIFTYAVFPAGIPNKVTLMKSSSRNYIQYNLIDNIPVNIEPEKTEYDLLFTPYGTIIYDDNWVATPYFVRGVFINPHLVQVALDSTMVFEDITYDMISDLPFSSKKDIIGHEWKDVKVDVNTNTAEYFVNTKLNLFIKVTEGFIYKMRFIEYYNSDAEVGYITIQYQRL